MIGYSPVKNTYTQRIVIVKKNTIYGKRKIKLN